MAGAAVPPAPVTEMSLNGGSDGRGSPNPTLYDSAVNSKRMSAVMDWLSSYFQGNRKSDLTEFVNLCLSLARSIDFSIGNNEVPDRSQELPLLVKQVCKIKNHTLLQAAIMVLMISIKNACESGWFSFGDSEELCNLAKEIGTNFCIVPNLSTEPICSDSVITAVMSRFYPRMKMGHVLAFLEAKPGYDAYVSDFQISKNMNSPEEKIRLFVVRTDNIDTSSCLVSPAKANILLNGKGVERRTNVYVDTGPQVPTIVNNLLKYGTNLIQAVGNFNGNYYIAVAYMSEVPNPDSSTLQDYDQHELTTVDSDSEIIVGSRVSLSCPISIRKIIIPVKGRSCKHYQCFDFDNYVSINSRRPSWRCPHCNQHACFVDLRIDQKMAEILRETAPTVSDVHISPDGSWSAINNSDETAQKPEDTTLNPPRDEPVEVLDLTDTNDVTMSESEDSKNLWNMAQSNGPDDSWSSMFLSTFGVGSSSNVRPQYHQLGNSNEYGRLSGTRPPSAVQAPTTHLQRNYPNTVNTAPSNVQQNTPYPPAPPGFEGPNTFRGASFLSPPQSGQQSQAQLIAAANQAVQMSLDPRTVPMFTSVTSPREQRGSSVNVNVHDPTAEMNWRPAARMRGALSGLAYTEAYNQTMNRANQTTNQASANGNGNSNQQGQPARLVLNELGQFPVPRP